MLECRGLSVSYGQHKALDNVNVRISSGEIVVILGANGAGKSTLLKSIARIGPAILSGQILVDGKSVTAMPPHQVVEAGVALVPEERRLFGDLSVLENLLLGAYARRARQGERERLDGVLSLFPILADRKNQVARTMSGGEQQMVAIGRAMMSAPAILMLDEPSLGLSPLLTGELFRTLVEIRKTGVGILLVEQNAHQGLAIADRGYLLENGHIVGENTAAGLARDSTVQDAYLGGAGEAATKKEASGPAAAQEVSEPARLAAMALHSLGATPPRARSDDLVHASIAEMVERAAEIQEKHVQAMRAGHPGHASAHGPGGVGSDSLHQALAKIEAAAASALKSKAQWTPKR